MAGQLDWPHHERQRGDRAVAQEVLFTLDGKVKQARG